MPITKGSFTTMARAGYNVMAHGATTKPECSPGAHNFNLVHGVEVGTCYRCDKPADDVAGS